MVEEKVPVKLYLTDRNFLEELKRKLKLKSLGDAQHKLVALFKKNKLHLDLKQNKKEVKNYGRKK